MAVGCGVEIGVLDISGEGVVGLDTETLSVEVVSAAAFFSSCGGWSVVECLPVVQGRMERNSSKVKTRGLQHFQPEKRRLSSHCLWK